MTEHRERRRDIRARISLPVVLLRSGREEVVEMVDASFRGLFLRSQDPPALRQLVKLRVRLPTRELELHGVVVRVVEGAGLQRGIGLRFFALNGQDRTDWDSFISKVIQSRTLRAA